jgi:hypothetical protein
MAILCNDCIGLILEFSGSLTAFSKCLLLSKYSRCYLLKNIDNILKNYDLAKENSYDLLSQFRYISKYVESYLSDRILGPESREVRYIYRQRPYYVKHVTLTMPCDDFLVHLKGIESLTLSSCANKFIKQTGIYVTGIGLKHLTGIKKLVIKCHNKITDIDLFHIRRIKTFIMNKSTSITDVGLAFLAGIEHLSLGDAHNISDDGLRFIKDVKILRLRGDHKITDYGLGILSKITELSIDGSYKISDNGMEWIGDDLTRLNIRYGSGITDKGIKYLHSIRYLRIGLNDNITAHGLSSLYMLKFLDLPNNDKISPYELRDILEKNGSSVLATHNIVVGNPFLSTRFQTKIQQGILYYSESTRSYYDAQYRNYIPPKDATLVDTILK